MTIEEIKTPDDILQFMEENIRYGWLDINDEEHIGNLENVRRLYRTASIEESLEHKLGTCVEQVNLMHHLLDTLGIPNKMFCTRVYETDDFNDLDAEEHMHCFVLYYQDGKVHQIEHPDGERKGLYHFETEETAIKEINAITKKRLIKWQDQLLSFKVSFQIKLSKNLTLILIVLTILNKNRIVFLYI